MSSRKTTLFYSFLIMVASLAVGMVLASRLDLTPASAAQSSSVAVPPMNSAPLSGAIDASTFRNIAKAQLLYDALDASNFYENRVAPSSRSRMNIPFFLKDESRNEAFLAGAKARGPSRPQPSRAFP